MKIIKYILVVLVINFSIASFSFAQVDRPTLTLVDKLSQLDATIQICVDSSAFKKLNDDDALKFYAQQLKIDNYVDHLGKLYEDEFLYSAHKFSAYEYANKESETRKKNIIKKYNSLCSLRMLSDIEIAFSSVKKNINK